MCLSKISYFTSTTCKDEFERHCHEDFMVPLSLNGQDKFGFKDSVKTRDSN